MADQRNLNLVHGPIFRFQATTRILKRQAQKYRPEEGLSLGSRKYDGWGGGGAGISSATWDQDNFPWWIMDGSSNKSQI